MVGAGKVHSLLWTFIRLRRTCKKAFLNISSDSYGDLSVTLKLQIAGQADQAPRRGGRQSSNPALASGPPPSLHMELILQELLHLPLEQGAGGVDLELYFVTREDDSLGLS